MITEDYVSFETAKLLKEKGFDFCCEFQYINCSSGYPFLTDVRDNAGCYYKNSEIEQDAYSAPTLQLAMKWLREVHHLTIDVFHFRDWKVNIKTIPDDYFKADYSYPELKPAETYEEACEAAIKYCLENLI